MNKPERILIISNTIDAGGAETFVMKVFRNIDRGQFVFDFLINKKDSSFYLNEINQLGGKVYCGYSKSVNLFKSFKFIYQTVKENQYRIVFCIAVHPIGFIDLLAAKLGGAKRLLIRSTNSRAGGSMSLLAARVSRPLTRTLADAMFAPSKEAGVWLFGANAVANDRVRIINNGVDVGKFVYSEAMRQQVRQSLNLGTDEIVIGHIGRFNQQKNHGKLIGIFSDIKKMCPNSILLLVGDGNFKSDIESLVSSLGLSDSVRFLGIRTDVAALLSAFDAMVFPSLYEGMPNTIIEAQATDLSCVISDTISPDVKITRNVVFVSLTATDKEWAQITLDSIRKERCNQSNIIKQAGYDIQSTTEDLIKYFVKKK